MNADLVGLLLDDASAGLLGEDDEPAAWTVVAALPGADAEAVPVAELLVLAPVL